MKRSSSVGNSRRDFLKKSTLGTSLLVVNPLPDDLVGSNPIQTPLVSSEDVRKPLADRALDLSPARWIWYPSARILQNTVVLFRRRLYLNEKPVSAKGWILGESRYRLFVNGERQQWGPAPSDPRWAEADPLDLTESLREGVNIFGAEVLYFGQGDGTWAIGKAGFIFYLEITFANGSTQTIVSDPEWQSLLCRSWQPGQYKRWYLRALQEEFDARLYPHGWLDPAYQPDNNWLAAMDLNGAADKPAICSPIKDYLYDSNGDASISQLRKRSVPLLDDVMVEDVLLREMYTINWQRPPEEYFESSTPNAFTAQPANLAREVTAGKWEIQTNRADASAITFELPEQVVGWPYFTITAPEGTIVELIIHEGHKAGGAPLLNVGFHAWTRFTCREGKNEFETFDFESLRWMQLHIRNARGPVTVERVGVRRRVYPWPQKPEFSTTDSQIQRVWDAAINTLYNCAQDTIVDCMGRERQQYSGDIGHVIHGVHYAFGARDQVARYVDTFGQGITNAGYFLDCWPAYDRLVRIPERELQLTPWGPLLDHGIGHTFDAYFYYLYTGDIDALKEAYPRLLRFFDFLRQLKGSDDLLPVENLGIPVVWIDHEGYEQQRHKMCVFNLYATAMMQYALAPLCRAFDQPDVAETVTAFGKQLEEAVVGYFWSRQARTFVVNQPWLSEERTPRYCDRSMATAVMYNLCPGDRIEESVELLATMPEQVGLSYPANAGWRLWGLAAGGRGDVVINEIRNRWGNMRSVAENNTLSENWEPGYDDKSQWSHAPVAPLYMLYMGILGLKPTSPGFATYELRPQLGDLAQLSVGAHTKIGTIRLSAEGSMGNRRFVIDVPAEGQGTLILPSREVVQLEPLPPQGVSGLQHFALPAGQRIEMILRHT